MISSVDNNRIKELCKLQKKKYRDEENKYLIEGEHLVYEALKTDNVLEVFVLDGVSFNEDILTTYVSFDVMKKISTMDTPPNMVALCKKKDNNQIIGDKLLFLDRVQDPGNLGTIIRSSVAFNVDTIILSSDCVDLYNPKVLRATQGIYNHINIVNMDIDLVINYLRKNNIPLYGTSVVNGIDTVTLSSDDKKKYCLIMGNEGSGIDSKILAICDKNLYIKMNKKVESLNVGVACSIILYELGR